MGCPAAKVAYLPQNPIIKGIQTLGSYVGQFLQNPAEQHIAEAMLTKMDLRSSRMTDTLSGGEARRLALASAMVNRPDVLLLDEPTNHLDLPTIEWIESHYLYSMARWLSSAMTGHFCALFVTVLSGLMSPFLERERESFLNSKNGQKQY